MPSEPKPLILVVEDQKDIAEMLSRHLEKSGMLTQVFYNAEQAFKFLRGNHANLMLLDINLPDRSGFDLMEDIKKSEIPIPVIFLTACDTETHIVKGLEMGGDDYMTKPFSLPEVTARISAVLRRTETAKDQQITRNVHLSQEPFNFCGAIIQPLRLEAQMPDGKTLSLGRKELGIMAFLNDNKGKVISRKTLIHSVWGVHADVKSRSLDQYIVKIRDQFTKSGCDLADFRTIHGVGYIYDPEKVEKV